MSGMTRPVVARQIRAWQPRCLVLLLVALAQIACGKAVPTAKGGESNWLRSCVDDSECGALSCLCGICTAACSDERRCAGQVEAGECLTTEDGLLASLCSAKRRSPTGSVCWPACGSDGECPADQVCLQGQCLLQEQAQTALAGGTSSGLPPPENTEPGPLGGMGPTTRMPNGDTVNLEGLSPDFGYNRETGCWEIGSRGVLVADLDDDTAMPVAAAAEMHTLVGDLRLTSSSLADTNNDAIRCLQQIVGDLIIEGVDGRASANSWLVRLPQLQNVSGSVRIEGTSNTNFIMLSLESIAGDLVVRSNASLRDLSGLVRLSFVGGDVNVSDNPQLSDCQAQDLAERVGAVCRCSGNGTPCAR